MSNKTKFNIDYFKALVAIAMADGILKDEEKEFFSRRAHELGFTVDSVSKMLDMDASELKEEVNTNIDKIDFVTDIIAMAMVDGEIVVKEYSLILDFAANVNVDKIEVDNTIRILRKLIIK